MIQQEETRSQAAVSESTMTRVGEGINFINTRHVYAESWKLNGKYNIVATPNEYQDGYITYPFAYEIIDVMFFNGEAVGSGGDTELDILWRPDNSLVWASIFTTTPAADSTSSPGDSIRVGQTKTGLTAPVLSKSTFAAYDVLRCDLLTAMTGNPQNAELKIWIRPIST